MSVEKTPICVGSLLQLANGVVHAIGSAQKAIVAMLPEEDRGVINAVTYLACRIVLNRYAALLIQHNGGTGLLTELDGIASQCTIGVLEVGGLDMDIKAQA